MIELLETLLAENLSIVEAAKTSTPRQVSFSESQQMIKVAIGMRRSGKTYLLYQAINSLLDKGILREQILLLNFEDDRLLPLDAKVLSGLIDAFYERYPENHHRRCYLFLDEIQNVPDWQQVVRRYFDTRQLDMTLTGSSAKLLSKEISSNLRGRSLATEVLPFSFKEYLLNREVEVPKGVFGQAVFDQLRKDLLIYLEVGGFPAVQTLPKNEWRETLQNYVDTVILKDVVERHNISKAVLLKYLMISVLKSSGSVFSVNKFYNDVKSQGYQIGKDTLHQYLAYLEDAFLIFTVPHYAESERIKHTRPKKIYAIDPGLVNAVTLSFSKNYGRLFETIVYLDLRRQKKTIYYYTTEEGYEIDFLTVDENGDRELIQIVWDMKNEDTLSRETRALESAKKALKLPGRIIDPREYLRGVA